jgi:hypothetical protein
MVEKSWHELFPKLNLQEPVPLGLIRVRSWKFWQLFKHHQVLAYRYERDKESLRLFIYDPNRPLDDSAFLSFPLMGKGAFQIQPSDLLAPVYSFFCTPYQMDAPPID